MMWLLLFMSLFVLVNSSRQCGESTYSIWGRHLKGHVVSTLNVKSIGMCYVECSKDPRCKSINFHIRDLICELNDADRHAQPWDYLLKKENVYSDYPIKVPFKEYFMTPSLLDAFAANISSPWSTTTDQITFDAGSINDEVLLKVPLVAAGELSDQTPLTVEITVANDVTFGETIDSDIAYGVSDGTNFIGIETYNKENFFKYSPCFGIEARSGDTKRSMKDFSSRHFLIPMDSSYPAQYVFTLKLDKPWSSCFIPQYGFTNTVENRASKRLKLSKGLTLEVYKDTAREKVGFKYIKVTIMKTD